MDNQGSFSNIVVASRALAMIDDAKINAVLKDLAAVFMDRGDQILKENQKDLAKMDPSDPTFDRLKLTQERVATIANDLKTVAALPTPLGIILEERTLPNGLRLKKVSVPLGVVGIIYEARPNVTVDAFSLCFKAGNACILKGGSDAEHSNQILVGIIQEVLKKNGIDPHVILLLSSDRSSVEALLHAHGSVDVIIPRGSQALIEYVRENATIPIIETGAGICHTYVDASADVKKAAAIVENAKTRRPSVCNVLDTLIVHCDRLQELPTIIASLKKHGVEIFADEQAFKVLQGTYNEQLLHHANPEHFGTEFLSLKMSIKTVSDIDEALDHIAKHGSKHSEAIVAEDPKAIAMFLKSVDAACVYANASTGFSDGAQFGLGAEIGISTQKLHARGPMGLRELTSYKWVIEGSGQVRE